MDTVSQATEADNFKNRALSDEERVTLFATCMRGNGLPVVDPELNSDNSIKWDIIKNNPDKPWNFDSILYNDMERGRQKWINDCRLRIIKELQIQKV